MAPRAGKEYAIHSMGQSVSRVKAGEPVSIGKRRIKVQAVFY